MKKPLLLAKHLCKIFEGPQPQEILKGIHFEAYQGESICITGKSGSGKSTLLNILATLEPATSGELLICGQDPRKISTSLIRNKHLGFIFQSFHLLEDFSLIENVLMPAKIARQPTNRSSLAYQRAQHLLKQVGLLELAHRLTKFLSGGEKQRACLARALCNQPDILFADEPTGNLDSYHTDIVSTLLLDFVKNESKTLILVTHDPDLACLCDKTFQLKDGFLHPAV